MRFSILWLVLAFVAPTLGGCAGGSAVASAIAGLAEPPPPSQPVLAEAPAILPQNPDMKCRPMGSDGSSRCN
jgi:hypothetical protein